MPESHRRPPWPPDHHMRAPAVAGRFYPADARELTTLVDRLLDSVAASVDAEAGDRPGPAYVTPHAALRYSGPTAAHVYARLRGSGAGTVALVGPAHYLPVQGCAVPATAGWLTPLGRIPCPSRPRTRRTHDPPRRSWTSPPNGSARAMRAGCSRCVGWSAGPATRACGRDCWTGAPRRRPVATRDASWGTRRSRST